VQTNRVAEMFTFAVPTPLAAEAQHMRNMMRGLIPTRDNDGTMARHLIFSRRDRMDKIRDAAIKGGIGLACLITYCVINALITRSILSGLYGIDSSIAGGGVLELGGGVLTVGGGRVLVNLGEEQGVYPMEVMGKEGGGVVRLRNNQDGTVVPGRRLSQDDGSDVPGRWLAEDAAVKGAANSRVGVIFGDALLDGYDVEQGSQIVGDAGGLNIDSYGNISVDSVDGDFLLMEVGAGGVGVGRKVGDGFKVDVLGDVRLSGLVVDSNNGSVTLDVEKGEVWVRKGLSEYSYSYSYDTSDSEVVFNVEGMFNEGRIGGKFGDIVLGSSKKIVAGSVAANDATLSGVLSAHDLTVGGVFDLTKADIVVNNTVHDGVYGGSLQVSRAKRSDGSSMAKER